MRSLRLPRGLQLEIVTSLFVVMLAGLAIIAIVMAALAARTIEDAALARLRTGARILESSFTATTQQLADVAPIVRARSPQVVGAPIRVFDDAGSELGLGPPVRGAGERYRDLLERARTSGEVVARGGVLLGDIVLVLRLVQPSGESGFLVVELGRDELLARLHPLLRAGGWVLFTAAAVFVSFGAYLLRRRIVLPLQDLSSVTQRLATGDLSVRIGISGENELADLAGSFNRMAESLEREHAELGRVHESLSRSRRLATVGQLAAGVAHEVGNPIAAILGYSEVMLRDHELSPRGRDMALRTRSEALRIRNLIRDMLDLSRPESVELGVYEPAELLEAAAERLRSQPLLAGIPLVVAPCDGVGPVEVDGRRVEQVLVNLVENAAHALRGVAEPRIELRAEATWGPRRPTRRSDDDSVASFLTQREPDAVGLEVVDNGPGIDPDVLPHVFDPFFTTKDPGEGSGLGLANAHRIAELLGGRLEAASEPGRTCFRLVLPAADTQSRHVAPPHSDRR